MKVLVKTVLIGLLLAAFSVASASFFYVSDEGNFSPSVGSESRSYTFTLSAPYTAVLVQTYGYGGSSNAPGGTNADGLSIVAGGFDPVVGFYDTLSGSRIDWNDDGECPPGALSSGYCFDSTLRVYNLTPGNDYTVTLSAYARLPGVTLGSFSGTGDLDGRTRHYAIDVTPIPEPGTFLLLGCGLVGLGLIARRKLRR